MKISTSAHYTQGYRGMAQEIIDLEKAGVDTIWFAESYSFDSVSAMLCYGHFRLPPTASALPARR